MTVCSGRRRPSRRQTPIERGLDRREAAGEPIDDMGPVVTLMMGRIEDWLHVLTERDGIVADPVAPCRGQVSRSSSGRTGCSASAAIGRGCSAPPSVITYHWSQLIGGDVVITMPAVWQRRFNGSSVPVRPAMDDPVAPAVVEELRRTFRTSAGRTSPTGWRVAEFDSFGPTVRTLRTFIASYHDLLAVVRDAALPNPDVRRA